MSTPTPSYKLIITDDWTDQKYVHPITANTDEEAIDQIQQHVDTLVGSGDWLRGGDVFVDWWLTDAAGHEIESCGADYHFLTPIPDWDRPDVWCGESPDQHTWTECKVGTQRSQRAFAAGRTSKFVKSRCEVCGLRCTETDLGELFKHGQRILVEYEAPARAPHGREEGVRTIQSCPRSNLPVVASPMPTNSPPTPIMAPVPAPSSSDRFMLARRLSAIMDHSGPSFLALTQALQGPSLNLIAATLIAELDETLVEIGIVLLAINGSPARSTVGNAIGR